MLMVVFQGADGWRWHSKNGGRITASSEAFASKSNAIRAAKAHVRAVFGELHLGMRVRFDLAPRPDGSIAIGWR